MLTDLIIKKGLFVSGSVTANSYYGDGSELFFTRLGTSSSLDTTLVIGNRYNDYENKQTTVFQNGDVVVSGSLTVGNQGVLILSPITTPPTAVSGAIYFSTSGEFFFGS
jgi:hypothetical protein